MKSLPLVVEPPQQTPPDPDAIEMGVLIMRLTPQTRLALYLLVLAISESEALAQLGVDMSRANLA